MANSIPQRRPKKPAASDACNGAESPDETVAAKSASRDFMPGQELKLEFCERSGMRVGVADRDASAAKWVCFPTVTTSAIRGSFNYSCLML